MMEDMPENDMRMQALSRRSPMAMPEPEGEEPAAGGLEELMAVFEQLVEVVPPENKEKFLGALNTIRECFGPAPEAAPEAAPTEDIPADQA